MRGGEKEEMVLNWRCPEERSEQRLCCCPWMEAGGEEKEGQTHRDTDKDGTHGQEQDRQQTIANSGGRISRPCAPPGSKRFNNLTIAVYPLGGSLPVIKLLLACNRITIYMKRLYS